MASARVAETFPSRRRLLPRRRYPFPHSFRRAHRRDAGRILRYGFPERGVGGGARGETADYGACGGV